MGSLVSRLGSPLLRWGLPLLLMLGLALGGWALWERGNAARQQAERLADQRDVAQRENQQRQVVIDALWANAQRLADQRRTLNATLAELDRTASDRLATLEELQRENAELRAWADARLPEPVIRLRERPAVTGAAAYRQALRDADALHPAGQPSDDQR
ncbi:LysB family phage lysis regulatory protein [Halomonas organivorans]|uniref:LysB family phage lysis regulatory protein n=1 Tax=Halomonas organivorans TaxID=257772 RepID=A0A7W5BYM4_9GAMM|nr:Rz-like lysis system protein LysB [Halomonas organivorans]MBB3141204.1 LysB family phage lysis regulatory protein [Halomonas organivorans]